MIHPFIAKVARIGTSMALHQLYLKMEAKAVKSEPSDSDRHRMHARAELARKAKPRKK